MRGQDPTPALTCSFCGKSQREVRKLIAGPAVYICDECIQLAIETIARARSEGGTTTLRCSFCGKSPPKVKMLVAAETARICNECITLCKDIIAEEFAGQKGWEPPELCEKCSTPLAEGRCVTCEADAEGLELITRSGYASVWEMASLLELEGLSPEMEKVPPARPEEKGHPLWNLYAPQAEVRRAVELLREDWAELLDQPAAAEAAARGQQGIDLDSGGVVTCPGCAHRFTRTGSATECPECGLGLGTAANAAPDEARSS